MNGEALLSSQYRRLILKQAHDFYRYPSDYLDISWLQDDPHRGIIESLRDKKVSRKHVSDYILQIYGLSPMMDCTFEHAHQRFCLLISESLQRLVCLAGALVYSAMVPRRAEDVGLSPDLHRFAVTKAPFLAKKPPEYCIDQPVSDWSSKKAVEQGICSAGLNMLACALSDVPPSVYRRLVLKFPQPLGTFCEQAFQKEVPPESVQETRRLILKLYREVDSSCSLLFD
ncbi:hypothetical protein BTA51_14050 [Hahella sp. CCB-MM4]|uniref:SctK family type III secretion system sorting platform protein n=1 Tax=Hahella sp. (strain CCB-MM4) TaxID=1926491 RepID=UPI000B9C588C|nr:SctK family type III secretion system sorting platform protein [Hahella sp. CCB-MM4]OZG72648.1 hypothetical protein BTA51_14050 [Hahella sp. CCB-MM4]